MTIDLSPLHARDREAVLRLFAGYPFKTWQKEAQGIEPLRLAQLLWDLAEPHIGKPQTSAWVAWRTEPSEAVGLAVAAPHAWHSEVFGRSMGRVLHFVNYVEPDAVGPRLLDAIVADTQSAGIEHLAARVDGQDWTNVQLLESRGFRCVDCSVKMARRIDDLHRPAESAASNNGIEIRPYEPTDLDAIQQIAARSHTHNHFYNDPSLGRDAAAALFQQWLRRCTKMTWMSLLVATNADGRVVGFVTMMRNALLECVVGVSVGIIDYIVVDRDVAGRGIGRALLQAALEHLAQKHQWAELRTSHDNYRAVAFYSGGGFRIVASDFVLHRWKSTTGST